MAASTHAAVTPAGIRDGDPAALAALVERRANSVLAYCEAVLPGAEAEEAAAEAFARFRAAVATAADPRALDPETLMLGATRHTAAAMVAPSPAPSGGVGRLLRAGRGAPSAATCGQIPALLAARAEGALGEADQERLKRHLERHPPCQALAEAATRAERSYAAPPERTVPISALTEILLALTTAAPVLVDPDDGFDFGVDPADMPPSVFGARPPALPEPEHAEPEPEPEPETETETEPDERLFEEPDEPSADDGDDELAPPEDEEPATATATATTGDAVADPPVDNGPGGQTAVLPAISAAVPASGRGVAHPRPLRHRAARPAGQHEHGVLYRYLLPGLFVAAALLIVMVVAGVFSGDPAPTAPAKSSTLPSAPPPGAPPVGSSSLSRRSAAEDAAVRRTAAKARKAREENTAAARRKAAAAAATPSTVTTTPSTSTPPAAVVPAPRTQGTTKTSAPANGTATPAPKAPSTAKRQPERSSGLGGAAGNSAPSGEPGVSKGTTP